MEFATINGISIHYQFDDAGTGNPLIVFSNSLATDFRIWQDCVDDLSADYSILRYDKRGHACHSEEWNNLPIDRQHNPAKCGNRWQASWKKQ